ncbi:HNH endonuclease [uncultured Phascolarctobacterium sp.]|uniref:HNH endonuclease n=1 Tax=Phascolarctobacterium sp. TaxID=2049039 RepID=UPI0025FC993C|nr:HNH endonuclease [uncultured Phascolarctobacterium sp.]
MVNMDDVILIKDVNKSLYSDGVRINVSHQHIFNPPTSKDYTKRGSAREITVIFNHKKFVASYRYEGQKNERVHLESIRFRKNLREEFKKVYPEPKGKFIISLGKDLNEFIFLPYKKIKTENNLNMIQNVYYEGNIFYKKHKEIERNPKVIKKAKELFKNRFGKVFCEICGFDFNAVYGERGKDFIEGHHKKFVSKMRPGEITRIDDIVLVCPNCHRMLHRSPYISVEDLKKTITNL